MAAMVAIMVATARVPITAMLEASARLLAETSTDTAEVPSPTTLMVPMLATLASTRPLPPTDTVDTPLVATATVLASTEATRELLLQEVTIMVMLAALSLEMPTVKKLATPALLMHTVTQAMATTKATVTNAQASTEVQPRGDTMESTTMMDMMVPSAVKVHDPLVAMATDLPVTSVLLPLAAMLTKLLLELALPSVTNLLLQEMAAVKLLAHVLPVLKASRTLALVNRALLTTTLTPVAAEATMMATRMLPSKLSNRVQTVQMLRALSTATMPSAKPPVTTLPKHTRTLVPVETVLSRDTDPTMATKVPVRPEPDPLRTMVVMTDMAVLTPTEMPMVPNPLRPTVMLPLSAVPVVTIMVALLQLLPTRLDTRRTLTESGAASTAPASDTESLALRLMRLTSMAVALMRPTVPELVLLESALTLRVAQDKLLPLLMVPTDGAVPEVTTPLLPPVRLAHVPMPVDTMMALMRPMLTLEIADSPTLLPQQATVAQLALVVAMVTELKAVPELVTVETPSLVALVTTGKVPVVPKALKAMAMALPDKRDTPMASMPLLDTTEVHNLLQASALPTKPPLLTVDTDREPVVATTLLLQEEDSLMPMLPSEMAASVVSAEWAAEEPTEPTTVNMVTKDPVVLSPTVAPSAALVQEMLALPSDVVDQPLMLDSAEPDSVADSLLVPPISAVLLASVPVATTTELDMLAQEALHLAVQDSATQPSAALAALSDLVVHLAATPSLPAEDTALVALVATAAMVELATAAAKASVASAPRATAAAMVVVIEQRKVMDIEHYDQV